MDVKAIFVVAVILVLSACRTFPPAPVVAAAGPPEEEYKMEMLVSGTEYYPARNLGSSFSPDKDPICNSRKFTLGACIGHGQSDKAAYDGRANGAYKAVRDAGSSAYKSSNDFVTSPNDNVSVPGAKSVDEILAALHTGTASVKAPKTVMEYQTFEVVLKLSSKDLATFVREEPIEPDAVAAAVGNVRMSRKMSAEIVTSDFTIESKPIQEQIVSETEDTTWTWQIHSDGSGPEKLTVRLNILLKLPGDAADTPRTINVANLPIQVKVSPLGWATHHWEWLSTALVIPLGGWLFTRLGGGLARDPDPAPRRRFRRGAA
jgi:hypothetical protein